MDIIHMTGVIGIVPNAMFPIMALPDAAFAGRYPNRRATFDFGQAAGEQGFDQPPTHAEIALASGQGPDAMHMFWQYNPSINSEGMKFAYATDNGSQTINLANQQIIAVPLQQIDGEEPGAAGMVGASVVGHVLAALASVMMRMLAYRCQNMRPKRCAVRTYDGLPSKRKSSSLYRLLILTDIPLRSTIS